MLVDAVQNYNKYENATTVQKLMKGFKVYKEFEHFRKTLKLEKTFEYFDEIRFRVFGTDLQVKLAYQFRKMAKANKKQQ